MTAANTCGHGVESSLGLVDYPPSSLGRPAVSSAEQLLHLLTGQLTVFMMLQDGRRQTGTLCSGGFLRIPALAVSRLGNDGGATASLLRCCSPGLHQSSGLGCAELTAPWEEQMPRRVAWEIEVDPARYGLSDAQVQGEPLTWKDGLGRSSEQVHEYTIDRGFAVSLRTQMCHGVEGSMMVATRPPGYHSTPHVHDCEQLNVVSEGELWGYMLAPDGQSVALALPAGSLWRVPALTVHWAWNRGEIPVTLLEYHTPGLQGDPVVGRGAVSLVLAGENARYTPPIVSNLFVAVEQEVITAAEAKPPATHPPVPRSPSLTGGPP